MFDFWNFHDSWVLVEHNFVWIIVALAFGIVCGWSTAAQDPS